MPVDSSGFRSGANCCMSAPRGNAFLFCRARHGRTLGVNTAVQYPSQTLSALSTEWSQHSPPLTLRQCFLSAALSSRCCRCLPHAASAPAVFGAGPHNMDSTPTRWPQSPRIVMRCAPRASKWPQSPRIVRPPGVASRTIAQILECRLAGTWPHSMDSCV